jgi:hypothetical protein
VNVVRRQVVIVWHPNNEWRLFDKSSKISGRRNSITRSIKHIRQHACAIHTLTTGFACASAVCAFDPRTSLTADHQYQYESTQPSDALIQDH